MSLGCVCGVQQEGVLLETAEKRIRLHVKKDVWTSIGSFLFLNNRNNFQARKSRFSDHMWYTVAMDMRPVVWTPEFCASRVCPNRIKPTLDTQKTSEMERKNCSSNIIIIIQLNACDT